MKEAEVGVRIEMKTLIRNMRVKEKEKMIERRKIISKIREKMDINTNT